MATCNVSQGFNHFHLEVGCISDRMKWVLQHTDCDDTVVDFFWDFHRQIERLMEEAGPMRCEGSEEPADAPESAAAINDDDQARTEPLRAS